MTQTTVRALGQAIAKRLGENGADFISETDADSTIEEMLLAWIAASEPTQTDRETALQVIELDKRTTNKSLAELIAAALASARTDAEARGEERGLQIARSHIHVAGTTVGKHIDECAKCGCDLRHPIHSSEWIDKARRALGGAR